MNTYYRTFFPKHSLREKKWSLGAAILHFAGAKWRITAPKPLNPASEAGEIKRYGRG